MKDRRLLLHKGFGSRFMILGHKTPHHVHGFTIKHVCERTVLRCIQILFHISHRYRRQGDAFLRDWDVLLCPTAATPAFPHDHSDRSVRTLEVDGRRVDFNGQLFWAGLTTTCFLPSTVAPAGLTPDGLPVGVQIAGAEFDDLTTLRVARLLADEIGGFVPPPGWD